MFHARISIAAAFAVSTLFSSAFAADTWEIDTAHAAARFKVRHMMVSWVNGEITGMKGTFTTDGKDIGKLKAEATFDVNTINTNNEKRDNHLKSADFFDAAKFPTITFKSTGIKKESGDKFEMKGELTLHGVTKPVTLTDAELTGTVKDPFGNTKRGFTAHTKLNRKDFGLSWNKALEAGGVMVGDDIDIEIDVEMQQAKAAKG
jgi:polyisoprenoid-binding protein YceI